MKIDEQKLSRLIGDIHDCALDPARWPVALKQCAQFVGGVACSITSKNAASRTGIHHYGDGGLDQSYIDSYFNHYIKFDPCTMGQYFAKIGEPFCSVDILPYEELFQSPTFQEWVKPQHLVDAAMALLDKTATSLAMCVVFRHERDGLVDNATKARLQLIAPHLRRAVLIGQVIDFKSEAAASLADSLDGLRNSIFLLGVTGQIIHANTSGFAMLAEGTALQAMNGKLTARDAEAAQALNLALAASGSGDAAMGGMGIAVPLPSITGPHYVAHALPLSAGSRHQMGAHFGAVAALFVHVATSDAPSPPEVIAKTYKLTPSELRVLLGIVQVGGVPETAAALGIAESTVRTHLLQIFTKTGANRQADLVKLVAAFASPLAC